MYDVIFNYEWYALAYELITMLGRKFSEMGFQNKYCRVYYNTCKHQDKLSKSK